MKVYTIGKCGECPSYVPDSCAYYGEFGECGRNRNMKVKENQIPPKDCPLEDWIHE